ncbi:magnesium chelatase family protein [Erwinia persicina]|jgi:magnesium chelatase family protein|uniref:YifB family Mg chelatase-like AAA ATPase n=1 Tax=Erwinia plantamica TaxID=3237104 RepID=A0ABW7CRV7_9GAMM|nr:MULTISPECIES: YifB family Mg chelatase-like AAA ATPase [Erwinia]MCP1439087.1 magnesium chelatase family protein [Erwinia persicina]MDN4629508.1 YifB family Mg chelatase-like AAA ATPase [Erwinia sp. PsM31]
MSLSVTYTRAAIGVEAPLVTVEVHLSNGLPALTLVGLPETTVKEARERVRSALINCGFTFPARRITVNLAPADLPKEGGRYDLPIAIAILAASEQICGEKLGQYELLGELALTGALRGVQAAIPAAMAAAEAKRTLILSTDNGHEASLVKHAHSRLANSLLDVCAYLNGQADLQQASYAPTDIIMPAEDLSEVIGQQQAKRALEIAAAGGHNLLLIGPPGTGKTMLATRLAGLLPPLSDREALESAAIASVAGSSLADHPWRQRPFRAPHHTSSRYALVGGGTLPKPGEISLAHNGVLFLDELPEFERRTLDALREPVESGSISLSRAKAKVIYPARFQLVAAMNPSPTGQHGVKHNRSTPQQTLRYLSRLSGPFLDRFDLSLEVPLLPPGTLSQASVSESSATVRQRVLAARNVQLTRARAINGKLTPGDIRRFCEISKEDASWLEEVLNQLGLSVRAWQRILKVARTIADLAEKESIKREHLLEALSYRAMDRLLVHLLNSLE